MTISDKFKQTLISTTMKTTNQSMLEPPFSKDPKDLLPMALYETPKETTEVLLRLEWARMKVECW